MMCAISRAMSSKLDCSSWRAETSLYSVSSTVSRSRSSVSAAPVVNVMVRISSSEAFHRTRLVRVHLDEVLSAGHRQHRLHAFLDAGELQRAARGAGLAVRSEEHTSELQSLTNL